MKRPLWPILIGLTILRIVLAAAGPISGSEAYLMLCAHHLDGGFLERPAGIPALIRISALLLGWMPWGVRLLSPLALLLTSYVMVRLARKMRSEEAAFWSVLAFQVLPLTNLAAVVMEGTMVTAMFWTLACAWAWLLLTQAQPVKQRLSSWLLFGLFLGIATQFSYQVGVLLPITLLLAVLPQLFPAHLLRMMGGPIDAPVIRPNRYEYLGMGGACLLLLLGWLVPFWWNAHHDWLQWNTMTWDAFWSWQMPALTELVASPVWWIMPLLVPILLIGILQLTPWFQKSQHKQLGDNTIFAHFLDYLACSYWRLTALSSLTLAEASARSSAFSDAKTPSPYSPVNSRRWYKSFLFLLLLWPLLFLLWSLGHGEACFSVQLALSALLLPTAIPFFLKTGGRKKCGMGLLVLSGFFSLLLLWDKIPTPLQDFSLTTSSWALPSRLGVVGVEKIAVELLRLRAFNTQPPARPPFLIAQTPELAALLGNLLPISYPELPGAPPVFTPESPDFSSQFQLWPHYADEVVTGVVDPLYTEESGSSPFLGGNALYVTTESKEELPQTISSAFATVTLVNEITLQQGNKKDHFFIYCCGHYQTLSL